MDLMWILLIGIGGVPVAIYLLALGVVVFLEGSHWISFGRAMVLTGIPILWFLLPWRRERD